MSDAGPAVSVALLPAPPLHPREVAVVVDVLRMTTTATVLAELGLRRLAIVADVERARERAGRDVSLLLGERHARPLPGFDGGNSPLEFTGTAVRGRTAVLCTTNGSVAVEACAGARQVLLGSLRNASAVARRAAALAGAGGEVRIVCAGTEGALSLDDAVAAGYIAAALAAASPRASFDDAALLVRALASEHEPAALLAGSRHGRTLASAGFARDIAEAARLDVTDLVLERVAGTSDSFAPVRVERDVE